VSGGIDASAYEITAGQGVSFTAKIAGNSGTPTGSVAFTDNGNAMAGCSSVAISGGAATCNTSALVAGSHAIRANYSGDATYGSGIMGPITETVNAASSSATTPASLSTTYNVQGLWWQPRESGWGVDLAQQGDVVFATLFTYDAQGNGQWLVMSSGMRVGDNAYSGPLYRTTGPAYDGGGFDPANVRYTEVGTAYLSFSDGNNGTLSATVNGVSMTKSIARFVFASTLPTCTMDDGSVPTENFQDLWWRSGGSESGWGVNITHQGGTLFATMFTYDSDGTPMWLEGSSLVQTGDGTFSGTLDRTTGPAFGSQSFDPARVSRTPVGSMTVAFSDAANGTLTYSVNGVSQSKPISRFVYSTPKTTCR
jgi:hypothetical protein